MASLKQNKLDASSRSIINRWKAKPIIYVEGNSDASLFKNLWFTDLLNEIDFGTAANGEGCTAVVNAVASDRRSGVRAYGIIDRDKLMADRNWALLHEVNDAVFERSAPYPDVKVTLRWEIENYLIEPEAIESYVACCDGGRATRSPDAVAQELYEHADALVPFCALNQALHGAGLASRKDGYTQTNTRRQVEEGIIAEHAASPFPQSVWNDYQANVPKIDAFAGSAKAPPRTKLHGLLRAVNGKAFLNRIKRKAQINHDITFHLAKEIKRLGVPSEIDAFVRQCAG